MHERDFQLFSKDRAIRGAKIGAVGSLAVIGGGALITGVGSAFLSPDYLTYSAQLIVEHPTEVLQVLGIHTAEWAVVGAAVDSFRPTSRFVSKFIEREIKTFKEIGSTLKAGYRHIRNIDLSQARYNLTRPDQADVRAKFFPATAVIGGIGGAAVWGMGRLELAIDGALGKTLGVGADPFKFVAEHPLESIATGIIFGLAAGTAIVATDR